MSDERPIIRIEIASSVEGSVTVRQHALADPDDVVVEVGGERVPALPDDSVEIEPA